MTELELRGVESLYRKRGRVVRFEDGTLVDIAERGVAFERDGTFFCAPREGELLARIDPARVAGVAEAIRAIASGMVAIERLIVSEGRAEHAIGGTEWQEASERVHVSLTAGAVRVIVDLGSFDLLEDIRRAATALARAEPSARAAPARLRLSAAVSAALLPALIAVPRYDVRIVQMAGGVDGMGRAIAEADAFQRPWPNWYRPSYRARPVPAPFNLRALPGGAAIDPDVPLAVALLGPPGAGAIRVLVEEGSRCFPCEVRLTSILSVAGDSVWYPYGAGSFGAEMML